MLHQPDLRITNYTCRLFTTFPLSPMLLSLKTWIKWPSVLTATAGLLSIIFHLLQYSKQQPSLSAHRATLMTKTDFSSIFFKLCRFHSSILLSLQVFIPWKVIWVKFDSSMIFLKQPQFFAMHSNQWHCFILYGQKIMSYGIFRVCNVGRGLLLSNAERFWN